MKTWRSWSPGELRSLREMYRDGVPAELIARAVGRSHRAVLRMAVREGCTTHREPWTEADEARLREMWGAGLHIEKVAAELGRSVSSIKGKAHKRRIRRVSGRQRPGPHVSDEPYVRPKPRAREAAPAPKPTPIPTYPDVDYEDIPLGAWR